MSRSIFFRVETYGLRARRRKGKNSMPWQSIDGVAAEAARSIGATSHVKGNVAVEVLAGELPMTIADIATDQARRAVDRRGHRLREDGAALIAAVASYPLNSSGRARDGAWLEGYFHWRDRNVTYAQQNWGHLRYSIVEHRDEEYWHLHILIVPRLNEEGQLEVGMVHSGIAARDSCQRKGHSTKVQNAAYRNAMKAMLDDYHARVGAPCGQSRKSDKPRGRLTRVQVLNDRRQQDREMSLNQEECNLVVRADVLDRRESQLEAQDADLSQRAAVITDQSTDFERVLRQLDEERLAFKAASATERQTLDVKWGDRKATLEKMKIDIAAASAKLEADKEVHIAARRAVMGSDMMRLAEENQRLKADLAAAERQIREYLVEQDEELSSAARTAELVA